MAVSVQSDPFAEWMHVSVYVFCCLLSSSCFSVPFPLPVLPLLLLLLRGKGSQKWRRICCRR